MNLLEETKEILSKHNKTLDDIEFAILIPSGWCIDNKDFHILEGNLEKKLNVEYYNGYGSVEVNLSLKLVGKNFWLERYEYDGSECWEYKELPKSPDKKIDKGILYSDFEEQL